MAPRVDDVPAWYYPLWLGWSWLQTLPVYSFMLIQRLTCRIETGGDAETRSRGRVIYAYWHENVWSLFVWLLFEGRGHVWMQHPARFMKPVHNTLDLMGIEKVLGSQGEEGRRAADAVAGLVADGASTAMGVDGPRGPVHELKKGILHTALKSGAGIVPLRFEYGAAFRLPTWDRKWIAVPFSRLRVTAGGPVYVRREEDIEKAAAEVVAALG
ncbi:MAG: DUF374 domain-containing protein [Methanobacteriota archaeon]